jgi:hypothetical protein
MRGEEVFLTVLAMVGAAVLAFPLVRALAERIRPRGLDAGVREELQLLREDVLTELQHTRREIADHSERIDFTERLLAKKAEQR